MVKYASREVVARALDSQLTVYAYDQVDRALETASRDVESPEVCNRIFYPEVGTWSFDWPPTDVTSDGFTLWLDEVELISVDILTNGNGDVLDPADYHLEPRNAGPPYDSIEMDQGAGASWDSGPSSWQHAISIAGVRGHRLDSRPAGALAGAVASTTATSVTVTDSYGVGVGDLLTIGTERLEVTGRALIDTTEDLAGNVDGEMASQLVPVTDGTAFTAGEEITIDAETMLVVRVAGNNLIVRRAVGGSLPAAHTSGAAIFSDRTLTVTRGALGTAAATHLDAAAITAQVYPGPVRDYVIAKAIAQVFNEQAGYARTVGTGDGTRPASGADIRSMRLAARAACGRRGRVF